MNAAAILIVPACEKGLGGGHLSRSVFLLRKLEESGREAYLWLDEKLKEDVLSRFGKLWDIAFPGASQSKEAWTTRIISCKENLSEHHFDFIIIDNFRTSQEEFDFWLDLPGSIPLIGIDEGGSNRNSFDFLIDLLPGIHDVEPNITAPRLLPLPKNRRELASDVKPLRILISFGAEDAAGLGLLTARYFSSNSSFPEITLVAPNHDGVNEAELSGVHVLGMLPDLKEHLAEYDLFITHFGLGAFEAVYSRVPVLIVSPTDYHEKLARNAGFYTLHHSIFRENFTRRHKNTENTEGILKLKYKTQPWNNIYCELRRRGEEIARRYSLEDTQKEDFSSYINRLAPNTQRSCPVCGEKTSELIARFSEETYRRCQSCGLINLSRLTRPGFQYDNEYFFDLYKKQYGKTYLEDFPALKDMGHRRVGIIKRMTHTEARRHGEGKKLNLIPLCLGASVRAAFQNPSLLDIGCAYGPFLAAAAEAGFVPTGIEPIEDAVRYVKEELGFTAWQGFFPDALPEEFRNLSNKNTGFFDVVTLWYVMEHFQNPGEVLREIHRLLKDGGVLAFSTPSYRGISGRKSLHDFLKNSPGDHFTVWSPGICKKIFSQYGFKLRKIVVTGHHPERFPILGRFVSPERKGLLYGLLLLISRLFRLGDTFEAYGVKINQGN